MSGSLAPSLQKTPRANQLQFTLTYWVFGVISANQVISRVFWPVALYLNHHVVCLLGRLNVESLCWLGHLRLIYVDGLILVQKECLSLMTWIQLSTCYDFKFWHVLWISLAQLRWWDNHFILKLPVLEWRLLWLKVDLNSVCILQQLPLCLCLVLWINLLRVNASYWTHFFWLVIDIYCDEVFIFIRAELLRLLLFLF